MTIAEQEITVAGTSMLLNNMRSAFCEASSALVISDLHVGKTAHFRRHGIAVPKNVLESDLHRLGDLLNHYQAEKLVVVGDLLHAGDNSDVDHFCAWRQTFSHVEVHLVEGNHDRISSSLEEKLCLTIREKSLEMNGLRLVHDFEPENLQFQITGHIHPGIVLRTAVSSLRLPCFAITDRQLLLPAFSRFTGLDTKNTPSLGTFYAFTEREIFKV